ncbi:helix-turn-helix domain-containing protein [Salipiger abyssi]|nr:helix-turn-helix domain-containing protein [Salipiger abyssi]
MITTAELCKGLGISRTRLDQWVSRGFLKPMHTPAPGVGRTWDLPDAMRAAITHRLFSHGIKLTAWGNSSDEKLLASKLAHLKGFKNDAAILALYSEFAGGPIRKGTMRPSEVAAFIMDHKLDFLLLINLDQLEDELVEKFPALA